MSASALPLLQPLFWNGLAGVGCPIPGLCVSRFTLQADQDAVSLESSLAGAGRQQYPMLQPLLGLSCTDQHVQLHSRQRKGTSSCVCITGKQPCLMGSGLHHPVACIAPRAQENLLCKLARGGLS